MKYDINNANVKIIGRTFFKDNVCWCGLSGSGISFECKSKEINITFAGDDTTFGNVTEGPARIGVYVNDNRVIDTLITKPEITCQVWKSEDYESLTIHVIKLSECAMSTMGIKTIDAVTEDGLHPTPDKPLKIEFIGDSITCGFGVDLENPDTIFETKTEDVTKAYAYKVAKALDADYSMVSYSGYGVYSGYTDNIDNISPQLVPTYYKKIGFSYGHPYGKIKLEEIDWNFDLFIPNIILINLGTNDASYCGQNKERYSLFKQKYIDFLGEVRKINPKAYILCVLGIMGDVMYDSIEKSVNEFKTITNDTKIFSYKLPLQLPEDGVVTSYHPTEKTHTKSADVIVKIIKDILLHS